MRTITSTFGTREEAEAASRRLQGIGVAPEGILVRDLAEPGGGGDGQASGIFVSAKVTPQQVSAANEILKRPRTEAAPPTPDRSGPTQGAALAGPATGEGFRVERAAAPAAPALAEPVPATPAGRPAATDTAAAAPVGTARPEIKQIPGQIPGQTAAAERPPQPARAADGDIRRQIALACLVVAAAFVLGALLRVFG